MRHLNISAVRRYRSDSHILRILGDSVSREKSRFILDEIVLGRSLYRMYDIEPFHGLPWSTVTGGVRWFMIHKDWQQ